MEIEDQALTLLLDLNGRSFACSKYTITFKVTAVIPSAERPHGLDYSLVLLDSHRQRIFAIDNAHAIKKKRVNFHARRIVWDHQHKRKEILPYEFISAEQLLEDFLSQVKLVAQTT